MSDLVGDIYDAAMQPDRWPAVMSRLSGTLGAALVMSALHRSQGMLLGVATGQDEALSQILRTRYNSPQTNPLVAAMPTLPVGVVTPRRSVHEDRAYMKSDLYNEIFRPQGLAHRAIVCLHRSDNVVCPLGVLRPADAGNLPAESVRVLRMVVPHLGRAVRLSLQMQEHRRALQRMTEALDRLALRILVVDESGSVAHFNRAAERMFRAQDGLWLRQGEILTWRHQDALELRRAIAQAHAVPQGAPETLAIQRRGAKPPYAAIVAPLAGEAALELTRRQRAVVVIIGDPDARPADRSRALRLLFRLSPRETQLAEALSRGKRLEDYASEAGISIHTARAQLRAVFAKTDTARQAELIRLLNGIPSVAADS